ncbi:aldo/keto reductase [Secundilactobacillus paracollinoides]|nr:aldo/keto reductase [Secundilactobacillus paracollinoides]
MTIEQTPKLALGTWAWGDAGGDDYFGGNTKTEVNLRPVVDAAMRSGLNFWDTAYAYGSGASEKILGNLLQAYKRDEYVLSTKFTPAMASDSDTAMTDMLAGSLKRLHTDYVDLYWIHNPTDVEKWTPQLIPLVKSGHIKRVGVSNHNLAQIKRANEILGEAGIQVSAVQNHFSLLYRSSEKAGILDYCQQHNITFFSYMVLEQGVLTGKYNTANPLPEGSQRAKNYNPQLPKLEKLTAALTEIGTKYDASAADIATAWAIQKGTVPIIGVTKAKYIADEQRAIKCQLSADEMARLETLANETGVDTRGFWEKPMTD